MTDKPQFVGKKVTIGELGKTQSGGTPSSKHPEFFNGSIPWIGTTALNGKFLGKNDAVKLITEEAVAKSATKIVPEKSIMVGIRVGVGKVAINAVPMCTSQDIVSIVGIDEASWNKEYISLALQYKAPLLAAQAQGATIAGITSKTLKAIEIPAIPINEQNRVVDILRKLENQVGFVRKQLCGLDALVKSRFIEMFGDPIRNPLRMSVSSVDETYFSDMSPIFTQGMVPSFQYSATERLGVPPEHISHSSPSFTFFPTNWGLLDVMR